MGLRSPFILELYGFQLGKEPCLVSPWCEKGTLLEYLSHHLPSEGRILELLVQVASGVGYLHSLAPAIIHGDVKPSNIVIGDSGQALLCDFGLSRLTLTIIRSPNATSGDPQGTRGFQAPEMVFHGLRTLAGDVYAFACLMLDVLTGHFPYYELPRDKATLAMHNQKMPDPSMHTALPESDPLWKFMRQCWDTTPTERPRMTRVVKEVTTVL
ncbi:hypothetical protein M407DRAFT_86365 [Tulasnella calospora MUT 4182]|uniref:Protein kinase domain-containing protein n=1 Tax=Tulasnella calospora MUT 4182 TaxID=1051891 RepID=A0A0C3Q1M3_9AGAM|nr:hypothetical protein M407DRAFT_86365 [Tulasnella calospora MUT 4182]